MPRNVPIGAKAENMGCLGAFPGLTPRQTSRDVGSCAALGGTADVIESSVLSYEYTDQAEFRCGFCFPRGPAPP